MKIPQEIAKAHDWWLLPDQLFEAGTLTKNRAVHIAGHKISRILDAAQIPQNARVWKPKAIAAPGFFDIQVNGGGGALFNTSPTPDGLQTIATAHRRGGTTWMLPTLVTDAPAVMEAAAQAIIETFGKFGICGIHIEGPHIAEAKRGVHAARWIRPLDSTTRRVVEQLTGASIPVLITVAPEAMAPGQIAGLVETGAVVALGHTSATAREVHGALREGATGFTHLFNAMSPMQGRAPGAVGVAINSTAFCSVIADGHHVADEMLRLAM
ncbi:MAG: N-acetylglucosamine-6-phosphate deacetylase, partial [Alphaproteobacteria bacterium]